MTGIAVSQKPRPKIQTDVGNREITVETIQGEGLVEAFQNGFGGKQLAGQSHAVLHSLQKLGHRHCHEGGRNPMATNIQHISADGSRPRLMNLKDVAAHPVAGLELPGGMNGWNFRRMMGQQALLDAGRRLEVMLDLILFGLELPFLCFDVGNIVNDHQNHAAALKPDGPGAELQVFGHGPAVDIKAAFHALAVHRGFVEQRLEQGAADTAKLALGGVPAGSVFNHSVDAAGDLPERPLNRLIRSAVEQIEKTFVELMDLHLFVRNEHRGVDIIQQQIQKFVGFSQIGELRQHGPISIVAVMFPQPYRQEGMQRIDTGQGSVQGRSQTSQPV